MRALRLLGALLLAPLLLGGVAQARSHRSHGTLVRAKHGKATASRVTKSPPKHGKSRRRSARRREVPPQLPTQIELTAVDLVTGTAHLDVIGTTRPPATRLFILTDQSGRRFVPSFAECHPPPGVTLPGPAADAAPEDDEQEPRGPELPAGTRWRCSLTIPRLYRRAPLAGMGMEWGSRAVAARSETVQRLWGEARAAAPLSAIAERPHGGEAAPPPSADARPVLPPLPETGGPVLDDDPSDPSDNAPPGEAAARDAQPAE
jgi:hypothetical protein